MVAICKKCRHIKIETDDAIWYNYRCKYGGKRYEYNYVLGVDEKVDYPHCRELNSNGKCPDFKKKLLAKKDKIVIPQKE